MVESGAYRRIEVEGNLRESRKHGTVLFPFSSNYSYSGIGLDFPLHWHDEMEIILVLQGSMSIAINDQVHRGERGDIFFINSKELHAIQSQTTPLLLRNYIFPANLLSFELMDYCQSQYIRPLCNRTVRIKGMVGARHPASASLTLCLLTIRDLMESEQDGYQLLIKSYLLQLLALLSSHSLLYDAPDREPDSAKLEVLRNILEYISEHSCERLYLRDVAGRFGFSEKYFSRYFKTHFGRSFVDYLNFIRLEKAAYLLLHSDEKLLEISLNSGFENLSYFIRCFKRLHGCTPGEFRKQAESTLFHSRYVL